MVVAIDGVRAERKEDHGRLELLERARERDEEREEVSSTVAVRAASESSRLERRRQWAFMAVIAIATVISPHIH